MKTTRSRLRLKRSFFGRDSLTVARELLNKIVIFHDYQGIITETEAYRQEGDPACHAARGMTARNKTMFEKAGYSYVYLIYGMYFCWNIVTESEGYGAAVLIRGINLTQPYKKHLNGPGKLCRELKISKQEDGVDLIDSQNFYILDNHPCHDYIITPRIGIKKGADLPWRFLSKEN